MEFRFNGRTMIPDVPRIRPAMSDVANVTAAIVHP
jgi:hypothetical protein